MIKKILNKLGIKALVLILTLSIFVSSFAGCEWFYEVAESKDEILSNISQSIDRNEQQEYVSDYILDWGLPRHDTFKFSYLETYFINYYVYEGGLTDTLKLAESTAKLFLDYYYDTIDHNDKNAVTDALLKCYVASIGDPYAFYRTPEETDDYYTNLNGEFGGIGVTVEQNYQEETIKIISIQPGSPAEKAGVMVGDYLYAIDGKTILEIGFNNAIDQVRGKVGTAVELTFIRGSEYVTYSIVREIVKEENAYYEYDKISGIGYVCLLQFKENTFEQFKNCIDSLKSLGAKGIIFDLRANPGGLVTSVCDVVSYLIPTGEIIMSYQYQNADSTYLYSEDDGDGVDSVVDLPFVVLCDEGTASAGEIFTAAIRDYRDKGLVNATIVGTTTYKKGVMQSTFKYPFDSSTVTFTVAYYNPPCGVNYHGIGVTPDVVVENSDTEDLQLKAAYEEMSKLLSSN